MTTTWKFREVGAPLAIWDWTDATPDPRALLPVREPKSRAGSRHIPVRMFSMTNGRHLRLESGLEHDLARVLDRSRSVRWLVPQPVSLTFRAERPRNAQLKHTPDLLSWHDDEGVTIWDARPEARMDEEFRLRSALTREACPEVGWRYEVFTGLGQAALLNERWLYGFRRSMVWHASRRDQILAVASGSVDLGTLFSLDDGSGELTSTVWHMLWSGELMSDLDVPLRRSSHVVAGARS